MVNEFDEGNARLVGTLVDEDQYEGLLRPRYANSWAAIIGINNYRHLRPLTYPVADAEGIADLLVTELGFPGENVFAILDPPSPHCRRAYKLFSASATKAAIEKLLVTVLPEKAQPDDRVFIFYAGHGEKRELTDTAWKFYLIPSNAKPREWHNKIDSACVLDGELYLAKHVFYVLDACYSGLAATRDAATTSRYEQDLLRKRARQVLTAGEDDQVVSDRGGEGHSIFTHYLLRGLSGEAQQPETGMITAFDLMRFVSNSVGSATNSAQTPVHGTLLGHRGGDTVFRYSRGYSSEAIELFRILRVVFDRPAFKGSTVWSCDQREYKRAMELVLKAINTGRLLDRSGNLLLRFGRVSDIANEDLRQKMSTVANQLKITINLIGQLEKTTDLARADEVISKIDLQRDTMIGTLNAILRGFNLQELPVPTSVTEVSEIWQKYSAASSE